MKLEIGKRYFNKVGESLLVLRKVDNPDYPFVVATKNGEEMYTPDGKFDIFEDSAMDIVRPEMATKEVIAEAKVEESPKECLARYCTNQVTSGEVCDRCRGLIRAGKSLPKAHIQEPKVIELEGEGWRVTMQKLN